MSRDIDEKTYRTFEEFEREELRRDSYFDSGYEILDEMFAGELDFEPGATRRASRDADDDEE
jgi:hypothetical protein